MTPDEAPTGTVVLLGHPSYARTATKQNDGLWTFNDGSGRCPSYDDLCKGSVLLFNPEASDV